MSLLEAFAAVLLVLGSLLVIRAVYLADVLDADPAQPAPRVTEAPDLVEEYPKAA